MEMVLDANIIFAALIREGMTAVLLIDDRFRFSAPEFLLDEFAKHERLLLEKTGRSKAEFDEVLAAVRQIIECVPKEEFASFLKDAEKVTPDSDDVPYVALALQRNCAIWSNDKRLKQQMAIPVYSTADLLQLFYRK